MMNEEFTGARYFLNIPAEVAHDPRIKRDKSILLFGEIYSMLNVTGAFYMSNKEIAKRLRCKTVKPVKEALNELESLGYIKRKIIKDEKTGAIIGRKITSTWKPNMTEVSEGGIQKEPHPSYDDSHHLVTSRTEGGVSEEPQIEHINRTVNRAVNKNNSSSKDEHIPYLEIIEYLNKKTNKNFDYNTPAYRRIIRGRWHDKKRKGLTVEQKLAQFKKVIDNKSFDWQGDKVMWKYMRPSTLFAVSHFDEYLNENNLAQQPVSGGYGGEADISDIPDNELPF